MLMYGLWLGFVRLGFWLGWFGFGLEVGSKGVGCKLGCKCYSDAGTVRPENGLDLCLF